MSARMQAAASREPFYTGRACKHGHGTRKRTSTGRCPVCEQMRAKEREKRVREAMQAAKAGASE